MSLRSSVAPTKKSLEEEILEEITEKFMEKILDTVKNVQDVLKKFQDKKSKKHKKTQE
jgi:hypothetical protein